MWIYQRCFLQWTSPLTEETHRLQNVLCKFAKVLPRRVTKQVVRTGVPSDSENFSTNWPAPESFETSHREEIKKLQLQVAEVPVVSLGVLEEFFTNTALKNSRARWCCCERDVAFWGFVLEILGENASLDLKSGALIGKNQLTKIEIYFCSPKVNFRSTKVQSISPFDPQNFSIFFFIFLFLQLFLFRKNPRFCGDFNSQGSSAVRQLLTAGHVLPEFRESGDPTEKGQEGAEPTDSGDGLGTCFEWWIGYDWIWLDIFHDWLDIFHDMTVRFFTAWCRCFAGFQCMSIQLMLSFFCQEFGFESQIIINVCHIDSTCVAVIEWIENQCLHLHPVVWYSPIWFTSEGTNGSVWPDKQEQMVWNTTNVGAIDVLQTKHATVILVELPVESQKDPKSGFTDHQPQTNNNTKGSTPMGSTKVSCCSGKQITSKVRKHSLATFQAQLWTGSVACLVFDFFLLGSHPLCSW